MKKKLPLATTLHSAVYILSIAMLFTCSRHDKHNDTPAAPPSKETPHDIESPELTLDPETQAWWTERVNYALRLSEPMDDISGSSDLSQMKPKDVVAAMMNDGGFYDMMADFTTYWLGTKQAGVFETVDKKPSEKVISYSITLQSQAVNAVKAMARDENYFATLFKETGPVAFMENRKPFINFHDPNQPELPLLPNAFIRAQILATDKEQVTKMIPLAKPETKIEFCAEYRSMDFALYKLGGPNSAQVLNEGDPLGDWCNAEDATAPIPAEPAKLLNAQIEKIERFITELNAIDQRLAGRDPRAVKHVTDLENVAIGGNTVERRQYSGNFFYQLQNSSTNRNRKRAAWALKRFFCDDLTPINVEAPSSHVGGQHGSDPACYSCHYKLDPMAGYFRELGNFGFSYATNEKIMFDDNVIMDRVEYEKPWKAAPESGRDWNIGYIRSTTDDKLNTFGSNFTDLLQLLQTAPEVKECFVRRAFEYVVGENQVVDRGWLKSVTAKMTETEKTSTTAAIKGVFADIVMSKAFLARDRNNNECYDLPNGTLAKNRAPCQIANIIERNCASCHSETSKQGGLDLTTWKVQPNGQPGFNHTSGGQPLPPGESFQKILDRLSTSDQTKRMPLMRTMPPQDLEALFLWLQKTASN